MFNLKMTAIVAYLIWESKEGKGGLQIFYVLTSNNKCKIIQFLQNYYYQNHFNFFTGVVELLSKIIWLFGKI